MRVEPQNLALYKNLQEYTPSIGDYVVWARWWSTWHGIVSSYDLKTDNMYIIFAGVPFLLLTMDEREQQKETKTITLSKIKNASQGSFAIQQHDKQRNTIWYI